MVSVYILLVGSINCSYSSQLPCWQSESQDCSVPEPDHHRHTATARLHSKLHFHSAPQSGLTSGKLGPGGSNKEQSQAQLSQNFYDLFSLCRQAGLLVLFCTVCRLHEVLHDLEKDMQVLTLVSFFFLTSWFRLTELDYNWQCWNCF